MDPDDPDASRTTFTSRNLLSSEAYFHWASSAHRNNLTNREGVTRRQLMGNLLGNTKGHRIDVGERPYMMSTSEGGEGGSW